MGRYAETRGRRGGGGGGAVSAEAPTGPRRDGRGARLGTTGLAAATKGEGLGRQGGVGDGGGGRGRGRREGSGVTMDA